MQRSPRGSAPWPMPWMARRPSPGATDEDEHEDEETSPVPLPLAPSHDELALDEPTSEEDEEPKPRQLPAPSSSGFVTNLLLRKRPANAASRPQASQTLSGCPPPSSLETMD
ncbi:unnamed protein product [Durusdinium trenchii]|uniref:Uncharacterized protein n=1 Tax=Durusdinium trenchii TaxID=1381693 RepID=A0ABP0MC61_9DINO